MTAARRYLPLVAFAGAIVIVHQLTDLAAGSIGVDLSTPAGRFRFLAAIMGRSAGFVSGDVLLLWAAFGLGYRPGIRLLSLLHLVAGLAMLLWIPRYMSDTGHLASTVGGQELQLYRAIVVRTLLLSLGLGTASLLAARSLLGLGRVPAGAAA